MIDCTMGGPVRANRNRRLSWTFLGRKNVDVTITRTTGTCNLAQGLLQGLLTPGGFAIQYARK